MKKKLVIFGMEVDANDKIFYHFINQELQKYEKGV